MSAAARYRGAYSWLQEFESSGLFSWGGRLKRPYMSRHKGEDAQAPGDECNGVVERSKVARVNNDPVTLLPAETGSRSF